MKKIKVCYTNKKNLGDAINPYIIENILGYKAILSNRYTCEISGIGSGLRRFFVLPDSENLKSKIKRAIYSPFARKKFIIWSAGFLTTPKGNEKIIRKNYKVASTRGKLSKEYIEKITGKKIDCSTGDGGLLASLLIDSPIQKKYSLGIIPHVSEKKEKKIYEINKEIPNSVIIDIEGDVIETLKTISQCECIISSSLHGLIFADSFIIPNKRIVLTEKILGDGFKYADYYSNFDINQEPLNVNNEKVDIDKIKKEYKITNKMIKEKQKEIIDAFNKYI